MLAMRERQNAFHADEALRCGSVADENIHAHEMHFLVVSQIWVNLTRFFLF